MKKLLKILTVIIIPYIYADTLVVGVSADYPPFEYRNHETLLGFDIDLANQIGEKLGCEIKFKEMNFAGLFQALNKGEIDMIISSVGKTEEREKAFDFSHTYYQDKLTVIHRKENNPTPPFNDLKIACQLGSVMEIWCTQNAKQAQVVSYDTFNQAIEALKSAHVDGVLIDEAQAKEFCKNNKNLSYSIIGTSGQGNAVALKKNSPITSQINIVLDALKNSGYLDHLDKKWIQNSNASSEKNIINDILFIGKGAFVTITYTILSLVISFVLGIALAILRHKQIGTLVIKSFVSIIRGTPVLLQLSFIYFSLPAIIGIKISVLVAGVLTFGINSSAYICEIIRSGLNAIPKGQFETAKSLGISQFLTWKDIILPQVMANIFPALINETVTLTKETALISVLGEMDIMRRSQAVAAEQYDFFLPLCIAGCIFWLLVKFIEISGSFIEKRFQNA